MSNTDLAMAIVATARLLQLIVIVAGVLWVIGVWLSSPINERD